MYFSVIGFVSYFQNAILKDLNGLQIKKKLNIIVNYK